MYVFGGYAVTKRDSIVYFNDVWAYNFTAATFEEIATTAVASSATASEETSGVSARGEARATAPTGPSPRSMHTAVIANDTMVMFGGSNPAEGNLGDTWILELRTRVWTELPQSDAGPSARNSATATVVSGGAAMVLAFGEGNDGTVSDVWSLDLVQLVWSQMVNE